MLSIRLTALGVLSLSLVVSGCHRQEKTREGYYDSGNRFYAQRKFAESIIEYRNALRLDAKYGPAHYQLAEAFMSLGDPNRALPEYTRAADVMPDFVDANLKTGQLLLFARKFEDAKSRAEIVLRLDPKNVAGKTLRGMALLGLRDSEGADAEITTAIGMDPKNAGPLMTRAMVQRSRGQYRDAEATLKQAIEIDPKSLDARMLLADFYLTFNRKDDAAAAFKQVIELDPRNFAAQQALARYYMETSRMAEAEAPLKVLAADGKSVTSQLVLADYYVKAKREAEAIAVLQKAAATEDGYGPANVQLATLDFEHKKSADAYKRIDEVIRKQPGNIEALVAKGRFLFADQKLDQALAQAQAAIKLNPKASSAHYLSGMIALTRNDPGQAIKSLDEVTRLAPTDVNAKLLLAQLQIEKGSADLGQQFADEAARLKPDSSAARLMQAKALMANGSIDRAADILKDLNQKLPNYASFHAEYGRALTALGDGAGARREFTRALELDSNSIDAVRGQVGLELRAKNTDRAKSLAEAQVKRMPKSIDALMIAAGTYAELGDYAQQEAYLRRVLEVDPTNSQAFAGLALLYTRLGKLDQARTEYEAIAKRSPESVTAPTMIGLILEAQRRPADAQKVYERLVGTNPTAAPFAANNLAWLYAESGANLDVALQLAQGAKQVAPNAPEITDTLGWIYFKKDLASLAIPEFEASVQGDPKKAMYQYHLGLALAKVGQGGKARQAFDIALKLQPGYREAEDARKRLPPG